MKLLNLSVLITIFTASILVFDLKAKADIFSDLNNIKQTIDRTKSNIDDAGSILNSSGKKRGTENSNNAITSQKYPCIEDVCIGDELKNLTHINWQPAKFNSILMRQIDTQKSLKAVGDPRSIKDFKPYWYNFLIDTKGAKILSNIKGFCQVNQGMSGIYLDKSGRKVRIGFLPQLSNDGQSQTLVVTSISQHIAFFKDTSKSQVQDLQSQIKQKYPAYYQSGNQSEASVDLTLTADPIAVYSLFITSRPLGQKAIRTMRENDFLNFPGCPKDPRIKL
jgi:hypothetical protein